MDRQTLVPKLERGTRSGTHPLRPTESRSQPQTVPSPGCPTSFCHLGTPSPHMQVAGMPGTRVGHIQEQRPCSLREAAGVAPARSRPCPLLFNPARGPFCGPHLFQAQGRLLNRQSCAAAPHRLLDRPQGGGHNLGTVHAGGPLGSTPPGLQASGEGSGLGDGASELR